LLAFLQDKSVKNPSKEGNLMAEASLDAGSNSESDLGLEASVKTSEVDMDDEYGSLQLRIFKTTLLLTVIAVISAFIFFDLQASISLLVGAFSGILYLRLLARGIGKLGKTSMSISKIQLLVPVLLVILVSKIHFLELWPALVGFILYKFSLIVQFSLEPLAMVLTEYKNSRNNGF